MQVCLLFAKAIVECASESTKDLEVVPAASYAETDLLSKKACWLYTLSSLTLVKIRFFWPLANASSRLTQEPACLRLHYSKFYRCRAADWQKA